MVYPLKERERTSKERNVSISNTTMQVIQTVRTSAVSLFEVITKRVGTFLVMMQLNMSEMGQQKKKKKKQNRAQSGIIIPHRNLTHCTYTHNVKSVEAVKAGLSMRLA